MKNVIYTAFLGVFAAMLLWTNSAVGQVCTPDSQYTVPGFYPQVLPEICLNTPYDEAITVIVPVDTFITIPGPFPISGNVTVDSIVVNNITDLPPGVTYGCNPSNCTFLGGSTGCISINGTPTASGMYGVDLDVTLHIQYQGNAFVLPTVLTDTIMLEVKDELVANLLTTPADCGSSNGSASVNVTSTASPFTYAWSTGDTTASVSALAAGSISVTVSDSNGCSRLLTGVVGSASGDLAIDSAATVIDWMGCAETPGGMVGPAVSSSATPITYSWSNNTSDSALVGLDVGTYTLTATDSAGCVEVESFSVTAPDTLEVSTGLLTDVACNGDSSGSASILVSGGEGAYDYMWNSTPPQTSAAAVDLPAGNFEGMVTDEAGCTKSVQVSIAEPPALDLIIDVMDETHAGLRDGSAEASISGGTPPYIYTWDNGDSTALIDSLAPGDYTLIVTDSNGCTLMEMITVLSGPGSVASLGDISLMKVYPNPSQGAFTFSMDLKRAKEVELSILNVQGQSIYTKSYGSSLGIEESIEINQPGIYLLQVQTPDESTSLKIWVR